MGKSRIAVLAVVIALGVTPALMADKGGKGKGRGNDHATADFDKHDRHGDDHDRGWDRREGHEYRIFGVNDGRPPGWSHGKKTGWRNCGLPPGQAKKYGCYTYVHGGRRYYYYRDDQDRIVVRRSIQIHGSVDIVR